MNEVDDELTMVRSLRPVPGAASQPPPAVVAAVAPSVRPVMLAPWTEPATPAPAAPSPAAPCRTPASEPALDSGDFPWSTDVPPPANHRRAAAAVWATIVAMPLMALVLTLALSRSHEPLMTAHASLSASLGSDLDAHAALAAMDPADATQDAEKVDADDLEDAVTAMVAEERRADAQRAKAAPERTTQFLRGVDSHDTAGKRRAKKGGKARSEKSSKRRSKAQKQAAQKKRAQKKRAQSKGAEASSSTRGGTGTLVAMAVGASCAFAVDGAPHGSGSSVKASVPAGSHRVTCTPIGGSSRSRSVKVEAGEASVAVFRF
jgi:hypothetical protein